MASLKVFAASSNHTFPPSEWLAAAGAPSHIRQGVVIVVAFTKKDVAALLTDRGLSQGAADALAKEAKLARPPFSWRPLKMLVDANVIDPATPGVYSWHDAVKNDKIVRIEVDGSITHVATIGYDDRDGLYVIPEGADQ
jgi:hypothetical protein